MGMDDNTDALRNEMLEEGRGDTDMEVKDINDVDYNRRSSVRRMWFVQEFSDDDYSDDDDDDNNDPPVVESDNVVKEAIPTANTTTMQKQQSHISKDETTSTVTDDDEENSTSINNSAKEMMSSCSLSENAASSHGDANGNGINNDKINIVQLTTADETQKHHVNNDADSYKDGTTALTTIIADSSADNDSDSSSSVVSTKDKILRSSSNYTEVYDNDENNNINNQNDINNESNNNEEQSSPSMVLTTLTDDDIEKKLIDTIERSILSCLQDDHEDYNNYMSSSSPIINNETNNQKSSNIAEEDDDNNDIDDVCNKSYGSRGIVDKSNDDDVLYEAFVSDRRQSMRHFLEDDLFEFDEEDARRPWRRLSTKTLTTSNMTSPPSLLIDKEITTTNEGIMTFDDNEKNDDVIADQNSLHDSSFCSTMNTPTDTCSHISLAKRALTAFNIYSNNDNDTQSHSTTIEQKSVFSNTNSTTEISASSSGGSSVKDKRISFLLNGNAEYASRKLNVASSSLPEADDNTAITPHSINNHSINSNHSNSISTNDGIDHSRLFNIYNIHNTINKETSSPPRNSINVCKSMTRRLSNDEEHSFDPHDYRSSIGSKSDICDERSLISAFSVNSIPSLTDDNNRTFPVFYRKHKFVIFSWVVIVMFGICFMISYLITNAPNNNNSSNNQDTSSSNEQQNLLWNILIEKHVHNDDVIAETRTISGDNVQLPSSYSLALSSDGNTLIYNIRNEINVFDVTQNITQTSNVAESGHTITKLAISGNGTCIVKLLNNIMIFEEYSSGIWKTYTTKLFDDNMDIESMSMSDDCTRISIGMPTYSHAYGINSGLVQIYDITQKQDQNILLKRIGQNITGEQPDYHTGYITSLSNDGNIVAVSSPNANINGNNSGQVAIYKLSLSNTWEKIFEMTGMSEDLLGSFISLSSSGERIAIGSEGHFGQIQVFQLVNDISWIKLGTTMYGVHDHDQFGSVFTLSGDGNKLFIPFNKTWNVYSWNDEENGWNNIGYLPASFRPEILSSSYTGNRLAIGSGENNIVFLYEAELMTDG